MNIREYFKLWQAIIAEAPHVQGLQLSFDEISENECYIKGVLRLKGDLQLYVAEYVQTEPELRRIKYRYHLQNRQGEMLVRWDNAAHHRLISSFPHHRHEGGGVYPSPAMDLKRVLLETVRFLQSE